MTHDEFALSTEAQHYKKCLLEAAFVVTEVNEEFQTGFDGDFELDTESVLEIARTLHSTKITGREIEGMMDGFFDSLSGD